MVLCGGQGRRFGGDKTRAVLAGRPLLDHVVGALPLSWDVVCVGPERAVDRPVVWCREIPPGGGPVAAIAAALAHVSSPVVVLLGGDMPHAPAGAPALADRLRAEPEAEAVLALDGQGRRQPLLAAYRTEALRGAMPPTAAGTPLMRLLDTLRAVVVPVADPVATDVDTREDLDRARLRLEP